MPELPEVQTTVNGLNQTIVGLTISDAWSDYNSSYWKGSESIRDAEYFKNFKKQILGRKIAKVTRRAKNILIELNKEKGSKHSSGDIILVHMKMTGHLLYGTYRFDPKLKCPWIPVSPESLKDPFNRHIHFALTFSNKKHLALCDTRKFAKVTLIKAFDLETTLHLKNLGPEPLNQDFTFEKFRERLMQKKSGMIKPVLMDQTVLAGIGNIYADESLFRAGIHPKQTVSKILESKMKELFKAIKTTLLRGIDFGGDSMSDYRNIHGEKGKFQEQHSAYRKTGTKCSKKGCGGTITRIVVAGRSTHFCNKHQLLN